jgi:DNA-binding transcriptional LysR family regulator
MLLDNLSLFTQIVEKGSMTAAAKEVGLSPTTVSERLAALEAHYGVVLLNRTTRALSLTDEGRTLLDGARVILDECSDLYGRIRHGAQTLSGPIRISAPIDLGRNLVADVVAKMLTAHPDLHIELLLNDGFVDLVGGGVDLALRFGDIADSSLLVRHLGDVRRVVCAAPIYLARHGAPKTPQDLQNHNCIVMRFGNIRDDTWRFGEAGKMRSIKVSGDRCSNDGALVREWALAGHGIVLKSELDVGPAIAAGHLVELLQDYAAPKLPLQMLFPPNRAQPRRVKEMAKRLAAEFEFAFAS